MVLPLTVVTAEATAVIALGTVPDPGDLGDDFAVFFGPPIDGLRKIYDAEKPLPSAFNRSPRLTPGFASLQEYS